MIAEPIHDIDYHNRRRYWKRQNSAYRRELPEMNKLWIQTIRAFIKQSAIDGNNQSQVITEAMNKTYKEVGAKFAREQMNKMIKRDMKGEDIFSTQMFEYVNLKMAAIIASIERTTLKLANEVLNNSIFTQSEIDERLENIAITRGRVIADDETSRASNVGQWMGAAAAGAFVSTRVTKRWIATIDNVVREAHDYADGQVVFTNEKYNVGGERLSYPQDPAGTPGNTINCRCVSEYGLEGR